MTEINFERKNSVCSEGVHSFKIVKSEEKAGGSGFPYWAFELTCIDEGPDKGQKVWTNVSLAPQARFKVDQFLDAVGAPVKGSASHEAFVGKTLRISIKWETYNGSVKAAADAYIPLNAAAPKSSSTATPAENVDQKLPADSTGAGFKAPF